jgi:TetR/AcrR family transcriptional regulator, transcriptional repressor for nem operon
MYIHDGYHSRKSQSHARQICQRFAMPRVSKKQSDQHRLAIRDASARLFRERGLHGVSVSDLMSAAGLTHGGFYGHFDSKDALAAEALEEAFAQSTLRWRKRLQGKQGRAESMKALVEGYLTAQSRDKPGTSCPTSALAIDVAREPGPSPLRAVYREGLEQLIAILAAVQQSGNEAVDRKHALGSMSAMVGAMVLARATRGGALSDEFLEVVPEWLGVR